MNVKIAFKNLEHTEALDSKINDKSQKFKKFFDGQFEVAWVCSLEKGRHMCDIKIVGKQADYHASAESDSLYKTLDQAVNKMEKQLGRQKEIVKQSKAKKGHKKASEGGDGEVYGVGYVDKMFDDAN